MSDLDLKERHVSGERMMADEVERVAREVLAEEMQAVGFRQSAELLRQGKENDLTAPALRAMHRFATYLKDQTNGQG